MKVLSPKKSNFRYKIFTIITVLLFAFFLSSNYWMSLAVKSKSSNYDTIVKHNDYNIKITDASYHDGICEFILKCKLMKNDSNQSYPKITSVRFDESQTEYKFNTDKKYDDYSQQITVVKPPKEFDCMVIRISSAMPDITYEDSYNEFGEVVPGHTEKGKAFDTTIKIDKRDMEKHHIEVTPGYETESSAETIMTYATTFSSTTTQRAAAQTTTSATSKKAESSTSAATTSENVTTEKTTPQAATVSPDNEYTPAETHTGQAYVPNQTVRITDTQPLYTDPPSTLAKNDEPQQTTTYIHVHSIKLSSDFTNNDVQLSVGDTTHIHAEIEPENAENKNVKWESNRPDIATVDINGKVTAVSKGKAIITASTVDKNLKASCMVTVNE